MRTKPLAFSVHLLTASGAALALMALVAATRADWRLMFGWLVVALIVDGELVALDEPSALRQMVFGGDVLQVDTSRAVDPEQLANIAGVTNVRQTAPRQLMVTVEEAAVLTPRIIDGLRAAGTEVLGIEEHQPTFDEVFAGLVEQRRAARAASEPVDGSDQRSSAGD